MSQVHDIIESFIYLMIINMLVGIHIFSCFLNLYIIIYIHIHNVPNLLIMDDF